MFKRRKKADPHQDAAQRAQRLYELEREARRAAIRERDLWMASAEDLREALTRRDDEVRRLEYAIRQLQAVVGVYEAGERP